MIGSVLAILLAIAFDGLLVLAPAIHLPMAEGADDMTAPLDPAIPVAFLGSFGGAVDFIFSQRDLRPGLGSLRSAGSIRSPTC